MIYGKLEDYDLETSIENTPLMQAVKSRNEKAVMDLLAAGADVNEKDSFGNTALMCIAYFRLGTWMGSRIENIIKALLRAGTEINAKNKDGDTAVTIATKWTHPDVVKLLIDHSHTEVNEALMIAAQRQPLDSTQEPEQTVKKLITDLLSAGAEVNARDAHNNTALMRAAHRGHLIAVQTLLAAGADANATDTNHSSALMIAAHRGNREIVSALLRAGAEVDARDVDGLTALMLAAEQGHTTTVEALLKAGADANAKNRHGHTALTSLNSSSHRTIVDILRGYTDAPESMKTKVEPRKQYTGVFRPRVDDKPMIELLPMSRG